MATALVLSASVQRPRRRGRRLSNQRRRPTAQQWRPQSGLELSVASAFLGQPRAVELRMADAWRASNSARNTKSAVITIESVALVAALTVDAPPGFMPLVSHWSASVTSHANAPTSSWLRRQWKPRCRVCRPAIHARACLFPAATSPNSPSSPASVSVKSHLCGHSLWRGLL